MSQIRVIYTEEPDFPATDQHPDAVRYVIGDVWVDAIGGLPLQSEIDAILHPLPGVIPPTTSELLIEIEALTKALIANSVVTEKEIEDEKK